MPIGYVHTLHAAQSVATWGMYRCTRHDTGLSEEHFVALPFVIFPQSGLMMKHVTNQRVPMDVNNAVFFNGNESYRVTHPCGCGDRGTTLRLSNDVLREVIALVDPCRAEQMESCFRMTHVPTTGEDYILHRRVVDALESDEPADAMWLEESALALISRAVQRAYDLQFTQTEIKQIAKAANGNSTRPSTLRAHADLGYETVTYLRQFMRESLTLAGIAHALCTSPFHLARVFKSQMGLTIHQYLTCLRLRESLPRLAEGEQNLTSLGLQLGFSSHSKFTAAFRREFGVTPSLYRSSV